MTKSSFTFVTLRDHMEAGQIHFEVLVRESGDLRFQIQSWARSRDILVDLAYDKLKLGQAVQTEMWTSFSENVVRWAKGRPRGPVVIETQRISPETSRAPQASESGTNPSA